MAIKQAPPTRVDHWNDDPTAWDVPTFSDGNTSINVPGISAVTGTGVSKLDKKSSPGTNGTSTNYLGEEGFKFQVVTTFWSREHIADMQRIIALLRPLERKVGILGRRPISVRHPSLDMHGIYQANVEEVSLPEKSKSIKGAMEITFKFTQFFPTIENVKGGGQYTAKTTIAAMGGKTSGDKRLDFYRPPSENFVQIPRK